VHFPRSSYGILHWCNGCNFCKYSTLEKLHRKLQLQLHKTNYNCTFSIINCTNQHKLHTKISLDINCLSFAGTLIQVVMDKGRSGLGRLGSFSSSFKDGRKESVRMAFLFTNHLLLTTRSSNGRLHLAKVSRIFIRAGRLRGRNLNLIDT